jgi:hypothetical protein
MFCPSDVSTGLVQIMGPIQQTDLNSITTAKAPISISFGSSIPSIVDGNNIRVDSSATQTTCNHAGKRLTLIDIQICPVVHTGYRLPGMTDEPIAEMILSFDYHGTPLNCREMSGILMCFPIYASGPNHHDEYLVYALSPQPTSPPPSIKTLFYKDNSDSSQASLAYTTCFETINSNGVPDSKGLYVIVFPRGICNTSFTSLSSSIKKYKIPIPIKGTDPTVIRYRFDDDGNKKSTATSTDGFLYTTQISSCSDEFKNYIQHFTIPPGLPSSSTAAGNRPNNLYRPAQYKCVPFDQLRDMSGKYVKLGSKSMEQVMSEQQKATLAAQNASATSDAPVDSDSTELILEIVGTGVGVILFSFIIYSVWQWKNESSE